MTDQPSINNEWLKTAKCVPCEGGTKPLTETEINSSYLPHLKKDWQVIDAKAIKRTFQFETFSQAIEFINKVAKIAEQEDHHPDICNFYSKVEVTLSTHAIGGLSQNDFIMAAKIETL